MAEKIIYDVQVKTGKAVTSVKKLDKEIDKTGKKTKGVGNKLSNGFKGLGSSIGSAIPMLGQLRTALMSTGIGAIAVALGGLAALFGSSVKKGAQFEKSLSTLKAVSGGTEGELSKLSVQAKELGSTTQFTAVEVVKLQTELAKLGFTAKDIQTSTPAILSLASSLEVDLASAAELAGSTVRAFGLSTQDTARVVDVMALSTSSSALNFEALKESLKLVAPTSRAVGVSIEKTAALLGVLANNGLKGSVAGTGLSKTFIELNKKGLTLEEGMAKVAGSSNKLNTAIELVGVVGAKSFLSLAESGEQIEGLQETFENAAGSADKMANIRLDNLSGDITKLSSAWEGLLLSIEDGNGLLAQFVRGTIQATTSIVGFFTNTERVSDSLKKQSVQLGVQTGDLHELQRQVEDTTRSEEDRNRAAEQRDKLVEKMKKDHPTLLSNLNLEKDGFVNVAKAIGQANDELINKIILQERDEEIEDQMKKVAEDRLSVTELELKQKEEIVKVQQALGLSTSMSREETIQYLKDQRLLTIGTGSIAGDLARTIQKLGKARREESKSLSALSKLDEKRNEIAEQLGITLKKNNEIIEDVKPTTVDDTTTEDDGPTAAQIKAAEIQLMQELELIRKGAIVTEEQEREEKLRVIEEDYKKRIELAKKHYGEKSEVVATLEEAGRIKLQMQKDVFQQQDDEKAKDDRIKDRDDKLQQNTFDMEQAAGDFDTQLEINAERREILKTAEFDNELDRQIALKNNKDEEVRIEQEAAEAKSTIQMAQLGVASNAVGLLKTLAGENKGLQKAALIAENAVGIAKQIISTQQANAVAAPLLSNPVTAAAGAAAILRNKISLGVGIATSVAATAKGLKALGGGSPGSTAVPGGGGGATPSSPTFNVVGQSPASANNVAAAADAQIDNNNNNPQRAYVVSTDITNQQQLDRDIEDSNTLG